MPLVSPDYIVYHFLSIFIASRSARSFSSASISSIMGLMYGTSLEELAQIPEEAFTFSLLQVSFVQTREVIDGRESTCNSQRYPVFFCHLLCTWKALRSRNTRSYASFGGSLLSASWTVSFSSGIRSSARRPKEVRSYRDMNCCSCVPSLL